MPRRWRRGARARGAAPQPRRIRRFLEPALLLQLHHKPAHAYALIDGLDRLGMDNYPADVSTIYRILYSLEEAGMVTSVRDAEETAGAPRRVYMLTPTGEEYLAEWVAELGETDRLLHRFLEAYDTHMEQHENELGAESDRGQQDGGE